MINIKNIHAGATLKSQLWTSSAYTNSKFSRFRKEGLKLSSQSWWNPQEDPKSYWLISVFCVSYKILKRLIYVCIEPVINPLLPTEQARFWCKKSTMDQIILLTENIKDFLSICWSDSGIWLCLAPWPCLQSASNFYQIRTWSEWSWSCSKTKVSPLLPVTKSKAGFAIWKTAFFWYWFLLPLFFNFYMYELPLMISRKFTYTDS